MLLSLGFEIECAEISVLQWHRHVDLANLQNETVAVGAGIIGVGIVGASLHDTVAQSLWGS